VVCSLRGLSWSPSWEPERLPRCRIWCRSSRPPGCGTSTPGLSVSTSVRQPLPWWWWRVAGHRDPLVRPG